MSFGAVDAARVILIVPPLFDEMNRVRAVLVGAMRGLAERGVATLLPDLPGCNESMAPMLEQSIESWRGAVAAAAAQLGATHIASVRGGGLVVGDIASPYWRLAAVRGASVLKNMLRTRIASDKEAGRTSSVDSLLSDALAGPIELSGYLLSYQMLASLEAAVPAEGAFDITLGDGPDQLNGRPLWLRAEPYADAEMSAALATELDRWSASCGG